MAKKGANNYSVEVRTWRVSRRAKHNIRALARRCHVAQGALLTILFTEPAIVEMVDAFKLARPDVFDTEVRNRLESRIRACAKNPDKVRRESYRRRNFKDEPIALTEAQLARLQRGFDIQGFGGQHKC